MQLRWNVDSDYTHTELGEQIDNKEYQSIRISAKYKNKSMKWKDLYVVLQGSRAI